MDSEYARPVLCGAALAAIVVAINPLATQAADLPQPMYTKAPPEVVAATPYRWSGLYIGGHLGYLWGRTRVDDDGVTTEHNARTDGVIGGATIGYNWQIGHAVFGLEGDFGWTGAHGVGASEPPPPPPPPPPVLIPVTTHGPNNYDVRWTSHLRGRLGYAFNSWLIFAAGGFSVSDFSFQEGAINTTLVPVPTSGGKYYGWSVGGGVEWAMTPNLISRLEYFYDDFGHKDYVGVLGDRYRVSLTGHSLRAALAYKFDPFER